MEKITSKITKLVLRNRNANKTIVWLKLRRSNYVFIVEYRYPYTYLLSAVQPITLSFDHLHIKQTNTNNMSFRLIHRQ